jgi:beta-lactam-binding protein with PASTA domain
VSLLLSSAGETKTNAVVLPSLLGLTSAGAIRAASQLGLVVSGVGDGPVVTAQTPGAGFRAERGDSVRVTLGGGAGVAGSGSTTNKPASAPISIQLP